jgi:hypothetical protein
MFKREKNQLRRINKIFINHSSDLCLPSLKFKSILKTRKNRLLVNVGVYHLGRPAPGLPPAMVTVTVTVTGWQ